MIGRHSTQAITCMVHCPGYKPGTVHVQAVQHHVWRYTNLGYTDQSVVKVICIIVVWMNHRIEHNVGTEPFCSYRTDVRNTNVCIYSIFKLLTILICTSIAFQPSETSQVFFTSCRLVQVPIPVFSLHSYSQNVADIDKKLANV